MICYRTSESSPRSLVPVGSGVAFIRDSLCRPLKGTYGGSCRFFHAVRSPPRTYEEPSSRVLCPTPRSRALHPPNVVDLKPDSQHRIIILSRCSRKGHAGNAVTFVNCILSQRHTIGHRLLQDNLFQLRAFVSGDDSTVRLIFPFFFSPETAGWIKLTGISVCFCHSDRYV